MAATGTARGRPTSRCGSVASSALDDVSFAHQPGRDPRADRAQRRRQDHLLQRDDRRLPADRRARSASTASRSADAKRHEITKLGIARTFQNIRLFPEMTALENVMVGADAQHGTSVLSALFRAAAAPPRGARAARRSAPASCSSSWASPAAPTSSPRNLPYGDQRRLEIARALATEPEAALPRRARRRLQPGREAAS